MRDFKITKVVSKDLLERLPYYELITELDKYNVVVKVHTNEDEKDLIEKCIREVYSVNDELAIQRQRVSKKEEFDKYYDTIEHIKSDVRNYIHKRNIDWKIG